MRTEEINKLFPGFQRIIPGVKNGSGSGPWGISRPWVLIFVLTSPVLVLAGYLLCYFAPPRLINQLAVSLLINFNSDILIFILAGFTAQMIDGALGMAYAGQTHYNGL